MQGGAAPDKRTGVQSPHAGGAGRTAALSMTPQGRTAEDIHSLLHVQPAQANENMVGCPPMAAPSLASSRSLCDTSGLAPL
jgi:hypothetical protein